MKVKISPTRRVVCEATVELPISAGAAWGQLRDFRSTAKHDLFHSHIWIEGEIPRAGANIRIEHRYLFWKTIRTGRILRWNERTGFAFSDLCQTDATRAFPHVLSYRVHQTTPNQCRLRIRVGGRWTAPLPRWLGRIWLWWVFTHVVRNARNQLLAYALATKANS